MDKFRTIYDVCYDVLYIVIHNISNICKNEENIFLELYNFLTTDDSTFEKVFSEIKDFNFDKDKKYYKEIMMLIIASSSYYLSLYQYERDISKEVNMSIVQDLEELTSSDVIRMFYDLEHNPKIFDYAMDYLEFSFKNYIFRNGCMETVLKQEKVRELLKINPFEIVNYINYIDLDNLLTTEKYIQEFIDLYDAALSSTRDENQDFVEEDDHESFNQILIQNFKDRVSEYFNDDPDKINEFYSYIFSNIYETLIVLIKKDKDTQEEYQDLLRIFDDCNCQFDELYMYFMNNDDVAFMLIDFFIDTNDDLYEEDLIDKRDDYIEVGNIETLRELNPYYDEENVVFEEIKQRTKEYPN